MAPTIPAGRVSVRVSTAYSRENVNTGEAFVSVNLTDTMAEGYERLPKADIVTFALTSNMWKELCKEIQKRGAKVSKDGDKKGRTYLHFKPQVVELVIQLSAPMAVKELDRKTDGLAIRGNVVKVLVREKGTGNGIRLED
jgi:hypothetical protein